MIPAERAHLRLAADTHPGARGKNNEDQFSVTAYQLGPHNPTPSLFAVVADGIGGHLAGEVASSMAVEMVSRAVAESDASQPTAIMQAAMLQASQAILAQAESDPEKQGMGTTCIAAWVIDNRLYIASVGNSRLYLVRNRRMHQLNIDHTWVQEAVDAGALTPEQARTHPNANVIRRYLGSRKPLQVDLRLRRAPGDTYAQAENGQGMRLLPGDLLLLASDGLTDMLTDAEILRLVESHPIDDLVPALIDSANQTGGKDNITVIALEVPGAGRKVTPAKSSRERKRRLALSLSIAALIAFVAVVLLGALAWVLFLRPEPLLTPTPFLTPTLTITSTPLPTP